MWSLTVIRAVSQSVDTATTLASKSSPRRETTSSFFRYSTCPEVKGTLD